MNRVYNFSAGPSMLPESVLLRAAAEMLDYEGSGQSVMEMSHRSKVYDAIIKGAESLLREVMEIPDNYKVLFLQGGASSQFAMVPLNLMTKNRKADYVLSGQFSTKAYKEAARFGDCKVVASSKEQNFSRIPDLDPKEFRPDADYFHICMNNTIYGTVFHALPETGDVPLVADISSCILSRPIDVSRFGVLYAGAQKNVAPAGLTIVIIREDLIGEPQEKTPTMFMYKTHAESDSMYNTPPCYSIYMVIHAGGGEANVDVDPDKVVIVLTDHGPGIADVEKAMQEGWSTAPDNVRSLGFGAGMGLPNMKKYSDEMTIDSVVGQGTTLKMVVYAQSEKS